MTSGHVFISHASADDGFVKDLRVALESHRIPVWVDSRNLRGGQKLAPEIAQAIEDARQVLVVLSPSTVNSAWVRKEIRKAVEVEGKRSDGYRVVPILLPGITPTALENWFDKEPVAIAVEVKPGGLMESLPDIFAALGEKLPDDHGRNQAVAGRPVHELLLKLSDPKIETREGARQVSALAVLSYDPPEARARGAESRRYTFTAPFGPIEAEDLRWYLERYYIWPTGEFKKRAERVEAALPKWGEALYKASLAADSARDILAAWKQAADGGELRFSVFVDPEPPEGAADDAKAAFHEAATEFLALPWETLHDGKGYLFQAKNRVRVRRRLPSREIQPSRTSTLPIRILLVSPRPEDDAAGYIDHRASALPLVQAIEGLGDLVRLFVLSPPTFPALKTALKDADDRGEAFDVVHFDGHGVYDKKHGLGALCFEDPKDVQKLEKRGAALVNADDLAAEIRGFRVPLVFLEACQSAKAETNPTASVAARLLDQGVASVVAMSHSVLVETARRFVAAFYGELARGGRVGSAMLAGQHELLDDRFRLKIMGAGDLYLTDWFVPVLFQEKADPQLVFAIPAEAARRLTERQRHLSLGELPASPAHHFQGRSRELLALERLLLDSGYAVIRGAGGAGKTTLAVELARWLVRTGRFGRAAFVSLEEYTDSRSALDCLGRQLLPEGEGWSVAHYQDLDQALQPVERALVDRPTILVLDNLESVLPDGTGASLAGAGPWPEFIALFARLLAAAAGTRLVFTSREPLGPPFDHARAERCLGALDQEDAIKLVSQVMANAGLIPDPADPGDRQGQIEALVESVHCHARALVLLAPALGLLGVTATTANLQQIMADLHAKNPNDRENSLYASVELSLRRLTPETRKRISHLAVFHGGGNIAVVAMVLEIEPEAARKIAREIIGVGLGEDMGAGFLRLDPALAPYLRLQMTASEAEAATERWAGAMAQLTGFLYEEQFRDARLAAHLTLLELPNLLAMLSWAEGRMSSERLVNLSGCVENLLANLGRPQALAQAKAVRARAAARLGAWSHARYLSESAGIDRLLEQGKLPAALTAAKQLLEKCLAAGTGAFAEAAYDTATAQWMVGRALKTGGAAEAALAPLAEARNRFQALAEAGNRNAEHMASASLTEQGNCLLDLGRIDAAAEAYESAISLAEHAGGQRNVAVGKGQLGTVRLHQRRYPEALSAWKEARTIFAGLGEPGAVAGAWHQIGRVHQEAGQHDQAEAAYRQSLAIRVREKIRAGEAASLNQLGNLSNRMGRLDEAMNFYRQAADIFVELQDLRSEGGMRSNVADTLIKLGRLAEARPEILRAIECKKPFGHAAEPWTTWIILHNLEQAVGNAEAAGQARQRAIQCFYEFRAAGSENQNPGGRLCQMVAQALQTGGTAAALQSLTQLLVRENVPRARAVIPKLQAILQGSRDPALAGDPELDYDDAAELLLLLRSLAA